MNKFILVVQTIRQSIVSLFNGKSQMLLSVVTPWLQEVRNEYGQPMLMEVQGWFKTLSLWTDIQYVRVPGCRYRGRMKTVTQKGSELKRFRTELRRRGWSIVGSHVVKQAGDMWSYYIIARGDWSMERLIEKTFNVGGIVGRKLIGACNKYFAKPGSFEGSLRAAVVDMPKKMFMVGKVEVEGYEDGEIMILKNSRTKGMFWKRLMKEGCSGLGFMMNCVGTGDRGILCKGTFELLDGRKSRQMRELYGLDDGVDAVTPLESVKVAGVGVYWVDVFLTSNRNPGTLHSTVSPQVLLNMVGKDAEKVSQMMKDHARSIVDGLKSKDDLLKMLSNGIDPKVMTPNQRNTFVSKTQTGRMRELDWDQLVGLLARKAMRLRIPGVMGPVRISNSVDVGYIRVPKWLRLKNSVEDEKAILDGRRYLKRSRIFGKVYNGGDRITVWRYPIAGRAGVRTLIVDKVAARGDRFEVNSAEGISCLQADSDDLLHTSKLFTVDNVDPVIEKDQDVEVDWETVDEMDILASVGICQAVVGQLATMGFKLYDIGIGRERIDSVLGTALHRALQGIKKPVDVILPKDVWRIVGVDPKHVVISAPVSSMVKFNWSTDDGKPSFKMLKEILDEMESKDEDSLFNILGEFRRVNIDMKEEIWLSNDVRRKAADMLGKGIVIRKEKKIIKRILGYKTYATDMVRIIKGKIDPKKMIGKSIVVGKTKISIERFDLFNTYYSLVKPVLAKAYRLRNKWKMDNGIDDVEFSRFIGPAREYANRMMNNLTDSWTCCDVYGMHCLFAAVLLGNSIPYRNDILAILIPDGVATVYGHIRGDVWPITVTNPRIHVGRGI